jgi:hypothetical protein
VKSLHYVFQIYNMNDTVSCSIWNGYGKKRCPVFASLVVTDDIMYIDLGGLGTLTFSRDWDKMLFTINKRECQ